MYIIHTKLASKKIFFFDEAKNVFEIEREKNGARWLEGTE